MPIKDIGGYGGSFSAGSGWNMSISEWSATIDVDVIDIPASFGELFHHARLGAARVTGSVKAKGQADAPNTDPFPLRTATTSTTPWDTQGFESTAVLTADTGCTYTGTFIFHNVQLRRDHNGYLEITAQFRNKGEDFHRSAWDQTG